MSCLGCLLLAHLLYMKDTLGSSMSSCPQINAGKQDAQFNFHPISAPPPPPPPPPTTTTTTTTTTTHPNAWLRTMVTPLGVDPFALRSLGTGITRGWGSRVEIFGHGAGDCSPTLRKGRRLVFHFHQRMHTHWIALPVKHQDDSL